MTDQRKYEVAGEVTRSWINQPIVDFVVEPVVVDEPKTAQERAWRKWGMK